MKIRKFLAGFLSAAMVAGACTVGASAAAPAEPTEEERCAAAIENYVEEKFKTNAKDPNSDLWATLEDAVDLYTGTPKVGEYTIDVGLDAITLQKEGVDQTLILQKSNVIAAAKNYAAVLADKTFPSNDLRDTIKTYLDTTEGNILLTHLLEPDYNFQKADITAVLNGTKFRDELCDAVWSIVFRKATLGDALNSLTDDDADSVKDFLGAIGKTISNDTKLSEIFVNKQNFKGLYDIFVGNDIFTGHFNLKAENALNNIQNNIQNALNLTPDTETTSEKLVNDIEQYIDIVPDKAGQFVRAVNSLTDDEKEKFYAETGACRKLDAALQTVVPTVISTPKPESGSGLTGNDIMTLSPTATNTSLAACLGLDKTETPDNSYNITLTTTQKPTSEILKFKLSLTIKKGEGAQEEVNDFPIPVTITFTFPKSFEYNSDYTYQLIHAKDNGTTENLSLTIGGTAGAYTGTFTTRSFSDFTVKATAPSTPGGGSVVPTNPTQPDDTYVSDTTNDITVNGAYTFKITSKNGKAPVFAVGTPGVFNVTLDKVNGNDYFYKVTAIGAVGAKAGIYINGGSRLLVATVGSTAASQTYVSDTTHDFSVDGAYTFKITSKNGKKPVFVVGTPGIFITQLVKQSGNDYFFKITAIGKPGQSAGIYINGESRLLVATVKSNAYYVSDTTYDLTVDKAYTFKITSKNGKTPTFAVGTPGVFDIKLVKQTGSDYFFKITAVGKSGSQTGIYIDGCPRLLVATVK